MVAVDVPTVLVIVDVATVEVIVFEVVMVLVAGVRG